MRFGMSGCFLPSDMNEMTPELCRRVRELGFSGIFTRFAKNDPHTTPVADARRFRDLLADHGVRIFQATGYWQNLVTPDEGHRQEAVRTLQAALKLAGEMGARGIDTGPGSMSPDGSWFPHPDNWTATCRHQLVKSLRECAKAAESAGVYLSLEGHQLVTLESAQVTREILDEVGSRWVRSDYDSANWLTRETIYRTTEAIHRDFDILGEQIVSCHAKDAWLENRLTLHIQDGCPGKGNVDFHALFQRMEALDPEYPIIAEGNSTDELPFVSALFHRVAGELGIPVRAD
jgi:sugar phosphate isomerase/epimerase